MRTRQEIEEWRKTAEAATTYPDVAIKYNTKLMIEILLDIRDLLDNRQNKHEEDIHKNTK